MRHAELGSERRGFSVLELLIALVILLSAGLPLLALCRQGLATDRGAQAAEARLAGAQVVLEQTALLPRRDLDIRLGERLVDRYVVRVARPGPSLYRVAIADTGATEAELLVTVLFRPAAGP